MSDQLKKARIAAGYSIEDIAKRLNIRKQYLEGIENGDFESLPSAVYIKGYLKLYAKHLKVELIDKSIDSEDKEISYAKKIVESQKFKKYLIGISVIMLFLTVTTYYLIFWQTFDINDGAIIESLNHDNDLNYINDNNNE